MSASKRLHLILATVLILILYSTSAYAYNEQTVTKNDITITSTKEVFYCEPVMNNDGCLIKADFIVLSGKENLYAEMSTDFKGFEVAIDRYKAEGTNLGNKEVISKKEKTSEQTWLRNGKNQLSIEFWSKVDGYFDVSLDIYDDKNNFLYNVLLDPLFNASFNASNPSLYLYNGTNMNFSIPDYLLSYDITQNISDNDSGTSYYTSFASSPISEIYLLAGYSFNDPQFITNLHSFGGGDDGIITGTLESVVVDDYYGAYFDGINDYVSVSGIKVEKDDFTVCIKFNASSSEKTWRVLSSHIASSGGRGWNFGIKYNQPYFEIVSKNLSGTYSNLNVTNISVADLKQHIMCLRRDVQNVSMWLDGISRDYMIIPAESNLSANSDLEIGSWNGQFIFNGTISQFGYFNTTLSDEELSYMNTTKSIGRLDGGSALSVYFNHSVDAVHSHFLIIDSNSSDIIRVRVMVYENSSNVNSSRYITDTISSGISYVSIDSIIYDGYNYPFRIWSVIGDSYAFINDVYLFETGNDTVPPVITNCSVNNTNLTCGTDFRVQCNIEDDTYIFKSFTMLNLTFISPNGQLEVDEMNKEDGIWFTDFQYSYDTFGIDEIIDLKKVNSTDLAGNLAEVFPNISMTYNCDFCIEDWILNYTDISSCYANDTYTGLIYYYDNASCFGSDGLPADNGTYTEFSCDYCVEDVVISINTSCEYNGTNYTYTETFVDNNYATCCNVTSIFGDCSIDYMTNPVIKQCIPYPSDIGLQCDRQPTLKKKMYCLGNLPDKQEYKCYSYVRQGDNYLQTNPLYKTESDAFSLFNWDTETETREYFTSQDGIVSFYFTNKDVIAYTPYILGLKCTNANATYTSEMDITPVYDKYENIEARGIWAVGRMQMIVVMVILLIFVVVAFLIFKNAM